MSLQRMAEIGEAVQMATPHHSMVPPMIKGPISKFSKVLDTVRLSSADVLESIADIPTGCTRHRLLGPC